MYEVFVGYCDFTVLQELTITDGDETLFELSERIVSLK